MIRPLLTVAAGTLASRLLGFLRDALIAALLGAGAVADAFLIAFQIVTVIRRFLAEGALNAALVPALVRAETEGGKAAAAALAGRVLGTVTLLVAGAALLLMLAASPLLALLAPGFPDGVRAQAADLLRLMGGYIAFAGPATVLTAAMNAAGRVALPALAPLLFNAALIAVALGLIAAGDDAGVTATVLAAAVGLVGLLQVSAIAIGGRVALASPLRIAFDAPMRALLRKAGPGMIASAAPQLLILAAAVAASASPSAVAWLYFASRLIDLPLGIVGMAAGMVLMPRLAHGSDDAANMRARSVEAALGLALPAGLGLIVLAEPIVRLLFARGAFTPDDSAMTARALAALALALPAQALGKIVAAQFYARGDTRTPFAATVAGVAATLALALVLGDATGAALAVAAGSWAMLAVLWLRAPALLDGTAKRNVPRIALAALVMAALAAALARHLPPLQDAALLALLIPAGGIAYGAALILLRVLPLRGMGTPPHR